MMALVIASGRGVTEKWHRQYGIENSWPNTVSGSSKATYDKLVGLGADPTADAVAEVIGNKSWTHPYCRGCEEYVAVVMAFGDDERAHVCGRCLQAAGAAVTAVAGQIR